MASLSLEFGGRGKRNWYLVAAMSHSTLTPIILQIFCICVWHICKGGYSITYLALRGGPLSPRAPFLLTPLPRQGLSM
jgi:hypothetical protein